MTHSGSRKPFQASPHPLALAVLALFAGASTTAVAADDEQKYVEIDPVVVTATRTAQPLSQAAASINVVQAKDIEQTAPQTFTDTLLDIPNVDVTESSSVMFSRISIRGSDANQITYLIDGMRQDDTTLSGNQFIGIFVDPEIVKQVEVKRGGGSSLYGNGGIGGTISVTTKSAADFLVGTDKNYGLKVKTGYATETQTWEKSAYAFGRYDIWDVLVGVNRRDGGEIKSSTGRRSHNDSDSDYTSIIAKITAMPTDELSFSLAYNRDEANDTWNDSVWGAQIYKNEQNRVTGNVEFNHGPLVNLRAAVQYVDSSYAADSGAANNKNEFDSIGGNLQNTFEFSAGGNHLLTIGGDFYRKTQSGTTLEGDTWVDATARPDAEATDSGIFLQDVYAFNEYVSVTPVVRWNHYERKSNTGFPTVSDSKVTPGVTLSITPLKAAAFWASVNTGYRPPIMDELYFTMVWPGIIDQAIVIANPDLKPEKSTNYEVGSSLELSNVLGDGDKFFGKLSYFYDDVKDFISPDSWTDPARPNIWYFTSKNIDHVVRKGIEFSSSYALDNFSANLSYGLIHAEDKESGVRVHGITPQSANLKLSYSLPKDPVEVWYRLHWSKGGESSIEIGGTGEYYNFGSFATHALGAEWSPKIPGFANLQAGVAVTNFFNKRYRMLNGSYGYGRGVRVWLSALF